jgi:O-antigen/teichoic acid export membrane protein
MNKERTKNVSFSSLITWLKKGDLRDVKVKRNVIALTVLKGLSMLIGFIMLPLVINYLEPNKYGIWLTLSSIIGWAGFFDFGLSNGLRYELGGALAENNIAKARSVVSTAMGMLFFIVVSLFLLFWFINPFLNWMVILNAPAYLSVEINITVILVFNLFISRFISGLIFTILSTDQRPALSDSFNTVSSVLSLLFLFILTSFTKNSLLFLGFGLSLISAMVPILASLFFFKFDYKHISPSIRFFDKALLSKLFGQGSQFFIMQIASLLVLTTDNLIISHFFGPSAILPYNISFKLFNYVVIVFGIFIAPFWAAFNEAFFKSEITWIKCSINDLLKLWFLVSCLALLIVVFSQKIYNIWIGDHIQIPSKLSFLMALYAIVQSFNMIFSAFINATGKIRLPMYISVISGLANIPLSIYFIQNLGFGVSGVILSTIICGMPNFILSPIQYYKLINNKAHGIWAK